MNAEQIGIAALCVSQGLMWWRNARLMRVALERNGAAHGMLNKIQESIEQIAEGAARGRYATREEHARHEDTTFRVGQNVIAKLEELRASLPRKRNSRKPKPGPHDTTIAPLERAKVHPMSTDPVGKVSS